MIGAPKSHLMPLGSIGVLLNDLFFKSIFQKIIVLKLLRIQGVSPLTVILVIFTSIPSNQNPYGITKIMSHA